MRPKQFSSAHKITMKLARCYMITLIVASLSHFHRITKKAIVFIIFAHNPLCGAMYGNHIAFIHLANLNCVGLHSLKERIV